MGPALRFRERLQVAKAPAVGRRDCCWNLCFIRVFCVMPRKIPRVVTGTNHEAMPRELKSAEANSRKTWRKVETIRARWCFRPPIRHPPEGPPRLLSGGAQQYEGLPKPSAWRASVGPACSHTTRLGGSPTDLTRWWGSSSPSDGGAKVLLSRARVESTQARLAVTPFGSAGAPTDLTRWWGSDSSSDGGAKVLLSRARVESTQARLAVARTARQEPHQRRPVVGGEGSPYFSAWSRHRPDFRLRERFGRSLTPPE